MADYHNCTVRYKRNNVVIVIAIDKIGESGNNYGLWIGTENPNTLTEVASFGSEDKANTFCKWLDFIFEFNNDKEVVKWDA